MVSGVNSYPQKEIMDWITKRFYSINSIIRSLSNKKLEKTDNLKFPIFKSQLKFDSVFIIGGGPSIKKHISSILNFLSKNEKTCVIHASSKNSSLFHKITNPQFFCLVGNEGRRLESNLDNLDSFLGKCILPPFPRIMGTYIPNVLIDKTFELEKITFTSKNNNSHTEIAIQTALNLDVSKIYILGYDGYDGLSTMQERELFKENDELFKAANHFTKCISLTPTLYEQLVESSIYNLIK
tara:strand:- start:31 stop:747 length:717 start_codon:yes stop_codon:yes gene_type:complete